MKNKKYLAWIFSGVSLNKMLTVNSFLINQLCENFEKIYFINMYKLKIFTNWPFYEKEFSHEVDNKLKVPNNIEIFIPKTTKDFKDFMIGKELIAINNIGRMLSDLKINFLLGRHPIKQVQIQNIGFHNTSSKWLNSSFWKNFTFKLNKYYGHKLYVLLSNFGLVPKIQIRFTSSSKIIDIINKSFVKKILFYLKLFYVKEFVLINSRSFDMFKKNKIETSEHKIVLIDSMLADPIIDPEGTAYGGFGNEATAEKHYYYLKKLINNLSNMYNKEVVVCLHPHDNLEIKKKYFPNLEVVQYQTMENIYKAFLVLFFDSSSIVEAIFHKKRILTLFSNYLGENTANHRLMWVKQVGFLSINIEDEIKIDNNQLLSKLDDAKKNYSNYIKSYLAPDGNNIGFEKIIKTLKERFFH
jgi:hypothetical protein